MSDIPELQRYNIALLPVENWVQKAFETCAHTYFAKNQNGYLLGKNALAHVTLCQFLAPNGEQARAAARAFVKKQNREIRFLNFESCAGKNEHEGFFWSWFLVEKDEALLALQKECAEKLAQTSFKIFTPSETYAPHVTLARTTKKAGNIPLPSKIAGAMPLLFRPALGFSTPNGVFVRELKF